MALLPDGRVFVVFRITGGVSLWSVFSHGVLHTCYNDDDKTVTCS
eukprot:SAG31_NODE_30080_length_385_cov_1.398601_2_plen_45_part_01